SQRVGAWAGLPWAQSGSPTGQLGSTQRRRSGQRSNRAPLGSSGHTSPAAQFASLVHSALSSHGQLSEQDSSTPHAFGRSKRGGRRPLGAQSVSPPKQYLILGSPTRSGNPANTHSIG